MKAIKKKRSLVVSSKKSVKKKSASADHLLKEQATVREETLDNGLRVIVKPDHRAPVAPSSITMASFNSFMLSLKLLSLANISALRTFSAICVKS